MTCNATNCFVSITLKESFHNEGLCCSCARYVEYNNAELVDVKGIRKPTHPLINDDSRHYQMVDGSESILLMEGMFTKEELMSWAKITSFKYRFRLGKKDDNAKDIKKMQTYEAYYKYLKGK